MATVRTTVTLADDVAAAVEQRRREQGAGLSEVVNELVRAGLAAPGQRAPFRQETHDLGDGVDVANIADTIETLDGPAAR